MSGYVANEGGEALSFRNSFNLGAMLAPKVVLLDKYYVNLTVSGLFEE